MIHNNEEEGIFYSLLRYILYLSPLWNVVVSCMNKKGTNVDDDYDGDEHKGPSWKSF